MMGSPKLPRRQTDDGKWNHGIVSGSGYPGAMMLMVVGGGTGGTGSGTVMASTGGNIGMGTGMGPGTGMGVTMMTVFVPMLPPIMEKIKKRQPHEDGARIRKIKTGLAP